MIWILSAGKISKKTDSVDLQEKGFTLLELISVLVLIGLFASLTAPIVMSALDRIQGESSVRRIVSVLASARSQAVAAKHTFVFKGNIDENQYWVTDPKTEKKSKPIQLDRTIRFREFDDGEDSFREGIFSVVFYPLGSTSGGTIFLEPSDADADPDAPSFVLTVDPVTGKPYLQHAQK